MSLKVKFWGVRGSIACPTPNHMKYGGNTSCVEVNAGQTRIVFDSGTGIRLLGKEMMKSDRRHAILLMSHTHWDHINGFPFFVPAFVKGFSIRILAGHVGKLGGIRQVFAKQMENPTFPVPLEIMAADLKFEDFNVGESFELEGGVVVKTEPLNHPAGATGYRLEYEGKSLCYVTDTEHVPGKPDENVLRLIEGADLVIYDATYTDEIFPMRVGWGHSTWQEGIRICQAANVKRLAIFHHDPDHEDPTMDQIAEDAKKVWDNTFVAREGMEVEV